MCEEETLQLSKGTKLVKPKSVYVRRQPYIRTKESLKVKTPYMQAVYGS